MNAWVAPVHQDVEGQPADRGQLGGSAHRRTVQTETLSFWIYLNQLGWRCGCEGSSLYRRLMPDLAAIVARNVRAERARRSWRQVDLAERLGWSIGMVSETENGKRRIGISDMPNLCRALDVPLSDLLQGAEREDLIALKL